MDMSHNAPMETVVRGGKVLIAGQGLQTADLVVAGDRIVEIAPRASSAGAQVINADHCLVLPGIVDIHGDAFERNIMPRPGTMFPLPIAILETDRQLAANGITTAYHGITMSWEPGLRSIGEAQRIIQALDDVEHQLLVDNRIHVRWETFAVDEVHAVIALFDRKKRPALAFNDHTTPSLTGERRDSKLKGSAERAMVDSGTYASLLKKQGERSDEVQTAIEVLASVARSCMTPMLSHDDATPEMRAYYRSLGVMVAEFPMNWHTAEEAARHGDPIVFGAPNVVRGGSHNGAISAEEAIRRGHCSILATDYYYPAPIHAAFHLAARGTLSLEAAWNMISAAPARAMNLHDRGVLLPEKRADFIVVPEAATRPIATIAGGRLVYRST